MSDSRRRLLPYVALVGLALIWGGADHQAKSVHDPTDARAVAFSDGSKTAVIESVVAQGIFENYIDEVAGRLKANGTLGGSWAAPEAEIAAEIEQLELPHDVRAARATLNVAVPLVSGA